MNKLKWYSVLYFHLIPAAGHKHFEIFKIVNIFTYGSIFPVIWQKRENKELKRRILTQFIGSIRLHFIRPLNLLLVYKDGSLVFKYAWPQGAFTRTTNPILKFPKRALNRENQQVSYISLRSLAFNLTAAKQWQTTDAANLGTIIIRGYLVLNLCKIWIFKWQQGSKCSRQIRSKYTFNVLCLMYDIKCHSRQFFISLLSLQHFIFQWAFLFQLGRWHFNFFTTQFGLVIGRFFGSLQFHGDSLTFQRGLILLFIFSPLWCSSIK